MTVLFFGTYDVRMHPRVLVLQEGFAAAGDTVVECNVPLGLDTAARVSILRRPWLAPLLVLRILVAWVRLWRKSRGLPPIDLVVVGYLGHFDVHLARRRFAGIPIVLDHLVSLADTAADRGAQPGRIQTLLSAIDRRAVRAADVVVVDTEEHREVLPSDARPRAVVVPVGAPGIWFRARRGEPAGGGPMRVVFFGLFTPLQGAPTIGAAIAELADEPGIEFTMVGHGQDHDEARRAAAGNPRVAWEGWVEPEQLPFLVASHDVCLGIFGTGAKAHRVVPNKVFQGAAAGCAIVTSDTAPQRRALGEAAVYVPPGDPGALAGALRGLRDDPARCSAARAACGRLADRAFHPAEAVAPVRARVEAP